MHYLKQAWKHIDKDDQIANTCDLVLELQFLISLQIGTLIGEKNGRIGSLVEHMGEQGGQMVNYAHNTFCYY
jgi:hypothetical protein